MIIYTGREGRDRGRFVSQRIVQGELKSRKEDGVCQEEA